MSSSPSTQTQPSPQLPTVVFDLKKNRIRIHKKTLGMLGNPEFVQFLVNPESKMVAIRASTAADKTAERVKWQTIKGNHCCEFYSKYFILRLKYYCYQWESRNIYRIVGQLNPEEHLAMFCLEDSVLVENELYEQEP